MNSTAVKRRRGTTVRHATFTGLPGEITVDTTLWIPVVHDGVTPGGHPVTGGGGGGGSGTVTSVSVVSANGLGGTVATATSTPAITLTCSISGLLKGNGTAISAAIADTDYSTPSLALAYSLIFG